MPGRYREVYANPPTGRFWPETDGWPLRPISTLSNGMDAPTLLMDIDVPKWRCESPLNWDGSVRHEYCNDGYRSGKERFSAARREWPRQSRTAPSDPPRPDARSFCKPAAVP